MAKLMRWGARAPDHVRGRYFADGTALVGGLLINDFKQETHNGVTAVPRLLRDTFKGWNKDWSHLQWTPR
jgi:FADH2 O2-dependent halogenase